MPQVRWETNTNPFQRFAFSIDTGKMIGFVHQNSTHGVEPMWWTVYKECPLAKLGTYRTEEGAKRVLEELE